MLPWEAVLWPIVLRLARLIVDALDKAIDYAEARHHDPAIVEVREAAEKIATVAEKKANGAA